MKMSNSMRMILRSSKKKTTTSTISSILLLRSLVSCSRLMVLYAEIWLINLLMLSYLQFLTQERNRKLNSVSLSWMIWSNSSDLTFWDLFISRLLNRSLNNAAHLLLQWDRLHLMVSVSWPRKQVHTLDKSQTTVCLASNQLSNSLCQQMSRRRRPRLSSSCMLKIMPYLLLEKLSSSSSRSSILTLWSPTGWVYYQLRTMLKKQRFKMSFLQTFCRSILWQYWESSINALSRSSLFWPISPSRSTWMKLLSLRSKLWQRISQAMPPLDLNSLLSSKISLLKSSKIDSSSLLKEAFTTETPELITWT